MRLSSAPLLGLLVGLARPVWGLGLSYSYVVWVVEGNGTAAGGGAELSPIWECEATGADFGFQLPTDKELLACAQAVEPLDACEPVSEAPVPPRNASAMPCLDYFGLAHRGNCSFADKARNIAAALGPDGTKLFAGAIVANAEDQTLSPMSGQDPQVTIPLYMVSHACAHQIITRFPFDKGYFVVVRNAGLGSLVRYLIPFIAVLGLAFLLLLVLTVVKFVRERRRRARRRLSSRNLRRLATKKYKRLEGEEADTCPICLDDFEDGEKLRVLPCNHSYHCKCVDPWLTKNRKVCPVCKRKVCPSKDDSSDSDDEAPAADAAGPSAAPTPTNSSNREPEGTADDDSLIPPAADAQGPASRLRRVLPGFLRRARPTRAPASAGPVAIPPPHSPIDEEHPPEDPDVGAPNLGFHELPDPEITPLPETSARQPRRKRHPAHGRNVPQPGTTKMSLVRSPPDEAATSQAQADPRTRALTHVLPGPLAPQDAPGSRQRPRHRNAAASAPADFRDVALEDDDDQGPSQRTRERDDSIAIDLDSHPPHPQGPNHIV